MAWRQASKGLARGKMAKDESKVSDLWLESSDDQLQDEMIMVQTRDGHVQDVILDQDESQEYNPHEVNISLGSHKANNSIDNLDASSQFTVTGSESDAALEVSAGSEADEEVAEEKANVETIRSDRGMIDLLQEKMDEDMQSLKASAAVEEASEEKEEVQTIRSDRGMIDLLQEKMDEDMQSLKASAAAEEKEEGFGSQLLKLHKKPKLDLSHGDASDLESDIASEPNMIVNTLLEEISVEAKGFDVSEEDEVDDIGLDSKSTAEEPAEELAAEEELPVEPLEHKHELGPGLMQAHAYDYEEQLDSEGDGVGDIQPPHAADREIYDDPASGKKYYIDSDSGEAHWLNEEAIHVETAAAEQANPLPAADEEVNEHLAEVEKGSFVHHLSEEWSEIHQKSRRTNDNLKASPDHEDSD